MSFISNRQPMLDQERTFMLWVELGSLRKVGKMYETKGIINPDTGKPFTQQTIWASSMRYVLDHPEEARAVYLAHGSPLSEEEWEKWLIYRAFLVYHYGKTRCIKWAKKHNLYDKYREIFDITFNIAADEE